VAVIGPVDLIAMAEIHFLPVQVKNGRTTEYTGLKGFLEKRAHMKIVAPFEIDDFDTFITQSPELFQYRQIMDERDFGITDPEFEEVAQDEQGVGVSRQLVEKIEQEAVIFIGFAFKMSICDKYLAHDGTIAEKQVQVKVKVEVEKNL